MPNETTDLREVIAMEILWRSHSVDAGYEDEFNEMWSGLSEDKRAELFRQADDIITALATTLPQRVDAAIERFHDSIIAWMDTRTTDSSLACDAAERELRALIAVASRAEVTEEQLHEVRYTDDEYYYVVGRYRNGETARLTADGLNRAGFEAYVKSFGFDDYGANVKQGDTLWIVKRGEIVDPIDGLTVEEMVTHEMGYEADFSIGLFHQAGTLKVEGLVFASSRDEAMAKVAAFPALAKEPAQ